LPDVEKICENDAPAGLASQTAEKAQASDKAPGFRKQITRRLVEATLIWEATPEEPEKVNNRGGHYSS